MKGGRPGQDLPADVSRQHSLRVDLEDWDGSTAYADAVCGYANLNGQYRLNGAMDYGGIMWYSWKSERSLKHVEMKIKPRA
nr:hypothetical protein BaRGS_011520 [Batillaria attramentaria]